MKKRKGLWYKIPLAIIGTIVCLFGLVWGSLNVFKYAIYSDYYGKMQNLGKIPGINDGFTPQGICVNEENNIYIMTGYQKSKYEASRIYITGPEYKARYVNLINEDGTNFTGHNGGIACSSDIVYVATDSKLFLLNLKDLLDTDIDQIKLDTYVKVNNSASFVFSNETSLIVGEFNGDGYVCENEYETIHDGTYYAIASEYSLNDLSKPTRVFSIRNKVQGLAMNEEGDIVLSTSYGLADSRFYYYRLEDYIENSKGELVDGAPLYYLDNPVATLKAPPMSEDMDYSNGKWITYTESACDKYIFGKFFFSDYFYSLDWKIK